MGAWARERSETREDMGAWARERSETREERRFKEERSKEERSREASRSWSRGREREGDVRGETKSKVNWPNWVGV